MHPSDLANQKSLIISTEEMGDIMKNIKSLEELGLLMKRVAKHFNRKQKNKKVNFLACY